MTATTVSAAMGNTVPQIVLTHHAISRSRRVMAGTANRHLTFIIAATIQ